MLEAASEDPLSVKVCGTVSANHLKQKMKYLVLSPHHVQILGPQMLELLYDSDCDCTWQGVEPHGMKLLVEKAQGFSAKSVFQWISDGASWHDNNTDHTVRTQSSFCLL